MDIYGFIKIASPSTIYEMVVSFTLQKDFNDEDGSSGPREATMQLLVHFINIDKIPFASPLVEIDRLQGGNDVT